MVPAVDPHVPSGQQGVPSGARIAHQGKHRGEQAHRRDQHPEHRFKGDGAELPERAVPAAAADTDGDIENDENGLTDKEPIVDQTIDRYHCGKEAAPVVFHQLFQRNEQ